jgi:hypothetical protein
MNLLDVMDRASEAAAVADLVTARKIISIRAVLRRATHKIRVGLKCVCVRARVGAAVGDGVAASGNARLHRA